jgi:hypothetical protein
MAANPAEAGPLADLPSGAPPGTPVAGQAGEGRLARAGETAGLGEPAGPGDPAACCGARTRGGPPCDAAPMANGRCRIHGGTSTGPHTIEGMARMVAAKTTHGRHGLAGAPKRAAVIAVRRAIVRGRLLCAASDLRVYLPAAMAARLALPVPELAASPHWSHLADLLNFATTRGSSAEGYTFGSSAERSGFGPGADGPAAGEQVPIEGIPIAPARRVAERLVARAEAAVRARWQAAIAFARAAKRESRRKAEQSGGGAARDLRDDPRVKRPGAYPWDEAVAVGSPGDSSLAASPRGPTLVSATQPEPAMWANWPLRDLRNDPRDERPGACLGARRRWLDRRGTRPCPRRRAARPGSTPPGPRPPCGQIGPCTICATTLRTSARGHSLGTSGRGHAPCSRGWGSHAGDSDKASDELRSSR